jgi:UDP-N-acetylmuramyl tripeptide synthase
MRMTEEERYASKYNAKKYFYSLKSVADFKGKILENSLSGLLMTVNDQEVHFRLIGEFNAYNLLCRLWSSNLFR